MDGCRRGGEHLKWEDGWRNRTATLSVSAPLPPTSVMSLQVSLALQYSALFSLPFSSSLFLPTPHPLSRSPLLLVFQQIVFSSLLLELQPDASLPHTVRYHYCYKPRPYIPDGQ